MSFRQFESMLAEIDKTFTAMQEKYPAEIRCKPGCDDCCNAFFDVSLIEAEYVQLACSHLNSDDFSKLKDRAKSARDKTEAYKKDIQANKFEVPQVGHWRVPCPMLTEEKKCIIYGHRPVTCRAYGLPTSIGDKGHVCGFSAFDKGTTYPTIKLDQINTYLRNLSNVYAAGKNLPAAKAQKRMFLYEIILRDL